MGFWAKAFGLIVERWNSEIEGYKKALAECREEFANQSAALLVATGKAVLAEDSLKEMVRITNEQKAELLDNKVVIRGLITINEKLQAEPLPDAIRRRKDTYASLAPGERGRIWWNCLKALWIVFAKESIAPYEDWDAVKVSNQILGAYPKLSIQHKDNRYRVTTIANVKAIVAETYVRWMEYLAEWRDCDDFAAEFQAHLANYTLNSCFEVWGQSPAAPHAFNLVVCTDGLLMVEPQLAFVQWADVPPGIPGYVPERFIR